MRFNFKKIMGDFNYALQYYIYYANIFIEFEKAKDFSKVRNNTQDMLGKIRVCFWANRELLIYVVDNVLLLPNENAYYEILYDAIMFDYRYNDAMRIYKEIFNDDSYLSRSRNNFINRSKNELDDLRKTYMNTLSKMYHENSTMKNNSIDILDLSKYVLKSDVAVETVLNSKRISQILYITEFFSNEIQGSMSFYNYFSWLMCDCKKDLAKQYMELCENVIESIGNTKVTKIHKKAASIFYKNLEYSQDYNFDVKDDETNEKLDLLGAECEPLIDTFMEDVDKYIKRNRKWLCK